MGSPYYLINAFTCKEFEGNPAAVVILNEKRPDDWMRSLAKELNQPITVFLTKQEKGDAQLRWFTPTNEIALCGHGTLGAAHILWSEGYIATDSPIFFATKSGMIEVNREKGQMALNLKIKSSVPIAITEHLKCVIDQPIIHASWAEDRYLLQLENEDHVHLAIPNLEAMKRLDGSGVVITSHGSDKYDFVSRYFAPKIGINEDYVTGSAHCALASYWEEKLNKRHFRAYQDSARGGEINLHIVEDHVQLMGNCITLVKGQLNI